jgi:hypothetical protein
MGAIRIRAAALAALLALPARSASRCAARQIRLDGPGSPIDLWYSAGQEWLALESTVAGGRVLRYRLQ